MQYIFCTLELPLKLDITSDYMGTVPRKLHLSRSFLRKQFETLILEPSLNHLFTWSSGVDGDKNQIFLHATMLAYIYFSSIIWIYIISGILSNTKHMLSSIYILPFLLYEDWVNCLQCVSGWISFLRISEVHDLLFPSFMCTVLWNSGLFPHWEKKKKPNTKQNKTKENSFLQYHKGCHINSVGFHTK